MSRLGIEQASCLCLNWVLGLLKEKIRVPNDLEKAYKALG